MSQRYVLVGGGALGDLRPAGMRARKAYVKLSRAWFLESQSMMIYAHRRYTATDAGCTPSGADDACLL